MLIGWQRVAVVCSLELYPKGSFLYFSKLDNSNQSRHFNDTSTILQRYFDDYISLKYGICIVEMWLMYGRKSDVGLWY